VQPSIILSPKAPQTSFPAYISELPGVLEKAQVTKRKEREDNRLGPFAGSLTDK
jgi:hypothetical protein